MSWKDDHGDEVATSSKSSRGSEADDGKLNSLKEMATYFSARIG
jgi:hypothetical protein